MKLFIFISTAIFFATACKIPSGSGRHYADGDPSKMYKLQFNPKPGTNYYYTIDNESEFKVDAGEKKVDNQNSSKVGLSYKVSRDSSGNFLLTIQYDKIHIHTKNDGDELDMDADNGINSIDPVEKLLGILKGSIVTATITPAGVTKSITGYETMKEKLLASFNANDTYSKNVAEKQWDKNIKEGLIRKNMEQLFRIFPDSAVHVGDKWRMTTDEQDEVKMTIKSVFTLEDINDGVATIRSSGDITSANSTGNEMGYDFTVNLNGKQTGEFEVKTATGLVIRSSIESDITGEMEMAGRKVPITIHSAVKTLGRDLK